MKYVNRRMRDNNLILRNALKKNKIYLWQLAEYLGISEITLCRKLRNELPTEKQNELAFIIQSMLVKNM